MKNPNDIVGYVVMENDNSFKVVKDLQVIDKHNLFYCVFETILQSLDCMNRNGREYNGDAIVKSLSSPIVTELIANNKFKGEYSHPIGLPLPRIKTVDEKCTSHRVTKWWRDKDNMIRGIVETLDDGMYGTKMTKSILQNENPSFSYRGFAEILNKNGHEYVLRPPFTVAYDEVNTPSHVEAYAVQQKNFASADINGVNRMQGMNTAYGGTPKEAVLTESTDASFAVTLKDMQELLHFGDPSMRAVFESFDVNFGDIVEVSPKKVIARRGGSTFHLSPTEKMQREIAGYMRSFH